MTWKTYFDELEEKGLLAEPMDELRREFQFQKVRLDSIFKRLDKIDTNIQNEQNTNRLQREAINQLSKTSRER